MGCPQLQGTRQKASAKQRDKDLTLGWGTAGKMEGRGGERWWKWGEGTARQWELRPLSSDTTLLPWNPHYGFVSTLTKCLIEVYLWVWECVHVTQVCAYVSMWICIYVWEHVCVSSHVWGMHIWAWVDVCMHEGEYVCKCTREKMWECILVLRSAVGFLPGFLQEWGWGNMRTSTLHLSAVTVSPERGPGAKYLRGQQPPGERSELSI